MANNVRSEYLQSLIEDKNNLEEKMNEIAKSTINNIMGENIEATLRNIISEAEEDDSFVEDEVENVNTEDGSDETVVDTETEVSSEETPNDDETNNAEGEETTEVDIETEVTPETTDGEEDVWNDLEQFKGEDGEYDLTGMDKEGLMKVMQVMTPEDGVRVIQNDNGTITLTDDTTEKEYIIDIDTTCDNEEMTSESKVDLGYGVHQKETAMTTPPNKEVAPNGAKTWDDVPEGSERRFGNDVGDGKPYEENVSEETIVEIQQEENVNETMTTQENGAYNRGTGMVHTNTNDKAAKGRNASAGGQKVSSTSDNSYSNAQLENIKRKANAIYKENKELKNVIIPGLRKQIQESIHINHCMGKIMKIVMENTTSVNEKRDIVRRFMNTKTNEESEALYKTISEELKRDGKMISMNNIMNSQLSESKVVATEKPMYQSEELSNALDLIKRMNNI